ncbi:MAG TPA: hypothetical protein VFH91_04855 [Pyrinomonadaceae bacterium]|jgi:hypothetical protein|nr:hypothetical protein [Pyrinomonadaceae bacterium]
MKRFHLIFGLSLFVVFLLTGQFMDRFHHHLADMPDGPRMLYRSRHIYILLSGLVHLGIGSYFYYRLQTWLRVMQLLGSALITIASVMFVVAFFYEPGLKNLYGPLTKKAVIITAVGMLLHLLGSREAVKHER